MNFFSVSVLLFCIIASSIADDPPANQETAQPVKSEQSQTVQPAQPTQSPQSGQGAQPMMPPMAQGQFVPTTQSGQYIQPMPHMMQGPYMHPGQYGQPMPQMMQGPYMQQPGHRSRFSLSRFSGMAKKALNGVLENTKRGIQYIQRRINPDVQMQRIPMATNQQYGDARG